MSTRSQIGQTGMMSVLINLILVFRYFLELDTTDRDRQCGDSMADITGSSHHQTIIWKRRVGEITVTGVVDLQTKDVKGLY